MTLDSGFSAKRTGNIVSLIGKFTTTAQTVSIISTGIQSQTRISEVLNTSMIGIGKAAYNSASGDINVLDLPAGTYILNHVFIAV